MHFALIFKLVEMPSVCVGGVGGGGGGTLTFHTYIHVWLGTFFGFKIQKFGGFKIWGGGGAMYAEKWRVRPTSWAETTHGRNYPPIRAESSHPKIWLKRPGFLNHTQCLTTQPPMLKHPQGQVPGYIPQQTAVLCYILLIAKN